MQVPIGIKNAAGLLSGVIPQWVLKWYSLRKHRVFFTTTRPIRHEKVVRILGAHHCIVVDSIPVNASRILRVESLLFVK